MAKLKSWQIEAINRYFDNCDIGEQGHKLAPPPGLDQLTDKILQTESLSEHLTQTDIASILIDLIVEKRVNLKEPFENEKFSKELKEEFIAFLESLPRPYHVSL